MRRLFGAIIAAALVFSLFGCAVKDEKDNSLNSSGRARTAATVSSVTDSKEEVRGVWIASVYNINFPSRPDLTDTEIMAELDDIVATAGEYGLNTLYFQVHPACDALYKSDIFPVSEFLYTDGVLRFDPLEYMIKICHDAGIDLFAWVNPLRVSTSVFTDAESALSDLPDSSPAKRDGLTVFYGDGKLYLNCGVAEVGELVSNAVCEIVDRYDVDGIVFDDYFYPYPVYGDNGTIVEFGDSHTYPTNSSLTKEDWRRENVNSLIRLCHDNLKSVSPDIRFGVAPFGIWKNDNNISTSTSGLEAYSELYCDAVAWIKGGYIDFISPQLYWECGSSTADFRALAKFWSAVCEGTDVELLISHGIYRYENEWDIPKSEIIRQVDFGRSLLSYKGSILYGYDVLDHNTKGAGDDTIEAFKDEVYYYTPSGLTSPTITDGQISGMKVTLTGFSDPSLPLSVNNTTVPRTKGGNFTCELVLIYGTNEFIFTDGVSSTTVTVIKR